MSLTQCISVAIVVASVITANNHMNNKRYPFEWDEETKER
jgi:hypothetical protein